MLSLKLSLLVLLFVHCLYAQDDEYTTAVKNLDWDSVKADIKSLLTDSQSFWPADFGNYGPLMIRLAWHCSGSYRKYDGRGGCDGGRIRFAPESAWPDNGNLDKARALLEPIKEKYGLGLSYGDLFTLAGDVAIESMGGPTLGFCAGRYDDSDGSDSVLLGPSAQQERQFPCEVDGDCKAPLGPTTIGLIYVNPEGPMGDPNPSGSALEIRDTFDRMGMNDMETVALIGGGHAFGKAHGACSKPPCGNGKGVNTVTSGLEGPWTTRPTTWTNEYFHNLLDFKWKLHKGPGGKEQWETSDTSAEIMMLTSDIALTKEKSYKPLVERFAASISDLNTSFANAWYKLTSRDMGPRSRCLGPYVPPAQPFQYPLPDPPSSYPNWENVRDDLLPIVNSNAHELVELAFLCAASFRKTDYSGGCNGARIRFPPQSRWPGHTHLDMVLQLLNGVKSKYDNNLSWADLIVYAGTLALGDSKLTFCPGRTDDNNGRALEHVSGKNFWNATAFRIRSDAMLMGFSDSEVVVLSARFRSAALLQRDGYQPTWSAMNNVLSNEYFKNLKAETWERQARGRRNQYKAQGKNVFILSNDYHLLTDAAFRRQVDRYAADNEAFMSDFRAAWTKLMNIDRYDGPRSNICWDTSLPIDGKASTPKPPKPEPSREDGSSGDDSSAASSIGSNIWVASILAFLLILL